MTQTITVYTDDTCDLYVELGTPAAPALVRWSAPRPPGRPARIEGYALLGDGGPVLVDPPAPGEAALERLRALLGGPPRATVLTNDWHERACYRLRDRWGTPVWAPAAGLRERGGELAGRPDHTYEEGTPLPGGLRALRLEGGFFPAEHLLLWRASAGTGVLFTGDAVNGQASEGQPLPDDWRRAPGLYVGVGPTMLSWLADPPRLQAGLRRALSEDFALLCARTPGPTGSSPRRPSPSSWRRTGRPSSSPAAARPSTRPSSGGRSSAAGRPCRWWHDPPRRRSAPRVRPLPGTKSPPAGAPRGRAAGC